jgi:hypothetical protein
MPIRTTAHISLLALTLSVSVTGPVRADPPILQSSRHDVLRVLTLGAQAPYPVPQRNDAARVVNVCVRDGTGSALRKAFDSQRGEPARFVVPVGGKRCAGFQATRQTFYFFKDMGNGMSIVLSYPVDLRGLGPSILVFDWVKDR